MIKVKYMKWEYYGTIWRYEMMRYFRPVLLVAIIALAIFSAGCLKNSWFYDFTAGGADVGDWYFYGGSYEIDSGVGLTMSHTAIATPVWFNGDLVITIEFDLDVDEENNARFEFWLADAIFWNYDEYFWWECGCLGDTNEEWWRYSEWSWEDDAGHDEDFYGEVPGILHEDTNIIKLYKVGDNYRVTLNGENVGSMRAQSFDGKEMFLNIYTGQPHLGNITIRKVNVEYTGDISDPWLIL